jgi:hypothetical protein
VRIISISAKCKDLCKLTFFDKYSNHEYEGYVPYNLGIGEDDYIELSIDIDSGKIINWEIPDEEVLNSLFKGEKL